MRRALRKRWAVVQTANGARDVLTWCPRRQRVDVLHDADARGRIDQLHARSDAAFRSDAQALELVAERLRVLLAEDPALPVHREAEDRRARSTAGDGREIGVGDRALGDCARERTRDVFVHPKAITTGACGRLRT